MLLNYLLKKTEENVKNKVKNCLIHTLWFQIAYPFTHGKPLITISPGNLDPAGSARLGNLLNPAHVPNHFRTYAQPFSFLDRLKNLAISAVVPTLWKLAVKDAAQVEACDFTIFVYKLVAVINGWLR